MINVTLNLATRPWYNRRLFKGVLAAIMLLLILLAGSGGFMVLQGSRELRRLENEIKLFDKQLTGQRAGLSEKDLLLQNQQVEAINSILERRSVQGWVQRLDDLEKLVPDGVALTRIEPDTKGQGLVLNGRSRGFSELQRLIESLAGDSRFQEPVLVSHTTLSTTGQANLLQFVVTVKLVLS